jgi:uncharacterized membrane protein YoaK (UPF0700 family)
MPSLAPRNATVLGVSLAFTAGFADASTFVGAGQVFCAHVTGNFVVLAADLTHNPGADEWTKLATFPIFVLAVAGSIWAAKRLGAAPAPATVRGLMLLKAALIGAAAAVGLAFPATSSGAARASIVALLVAAMGIQNALHSLNPALGPMTTVMTGNVTRWLSEWVAPPVPPDRARRSLLGLIIGGFALGCAGGAWGVAHHGFGVLALPAAVVLAARSHVR